MLSIYQGRAIKNKSQVTDSRQIITLSGFIVVLIMPVQAGSLPRLLNENTY